MIAWAPNIEKRPWIKRLANIFGAIPIDPHQAQKDRRRLSRGPRSRSQTAIWSASFPKAA